MEPTDRQYTEIAMAALCSAMERAKSMGFTEVEGMSGVLMAAEGVGKFASLYVLLGPKALNELAESLKEKEERDAVSQAEEILKEAGDD